MARWRERELDKGKKDGSINQHGVPMVRIKKDEPEKNERTLTEPEKKEKEEVVKGMKKNKSDFKKRYGKDAESVMYATATNIAKEKA